MRLGVLGSINRDTITSADGRTTESLGGVLYTACAAAHLGTARRGEAGICVRPIARLGEDVGDAVLELVDHTPQLSAQGLMKWRGPAFHSHIQYLVDGSKREVLVGDLPPLSLEEIAPHLRGVDALLVNFITGVELCLDSLVEIRRHMAGPILVDVHSLTLGRRPGGERYWRCPPDWRQWVEASDVVQMNEDEAAVLMGAGPSAATPDAEAPGLSRFARQLVNLGVRLAAVTRGPLGVVAAARRADGTIEDLIEEPPFVTAPSGATAGDPTGCGDVFLAGLGVATLMGLGSRAALQLANRAAARNCELSGIEELHRLAAVC